MSTSNSHPLVSAFEKLVALRQYLAANPHDGPGRFVAYVAANMSRSCSQLFQDLLVLYFLQEKKNGFFVEFGATDGVEKSNTLLLERQHGWSGILAEPARCWHAALKSNRRARIDTRCVWSETGVQLEFTEAPSPELSTLSALVDKDFNRESRSGGTSYKVDTISLNDLLRAHACPAEIDYLSIDTEGSELPILRAFDFGKYDVKIFTVEHNYCEPDRQQINQLLTGRGYFRLFEPLSQFDDWYIKRPILGF